VGGCHPVNAIAQCIMDIAAELTIRKRTLLVFFQGTGYTLLPFAILDIICFIEEKNCMSLGGYLQLQKSNIKIMTIIKNQNLK
jgi:hypothetical protein